MPYVLDIIIVIILSICIWRGFKRGFIASAFGILTFLLAAGLSFMFYVPFSEYIVKTPVGQNVSDAVNRSVYQSVSSFMVDEKDDSVTTENLLDELKIPNFLREIVYQGSDFLIRNTKKTVTEAVSVSLSGAIIKIAAGLLLFILLLIGIWIVRIILELIFKLPLLSGINKITGGAAGLVNGVLLSYLVLAVVSFLITFIGTDWLRETAEQSYIFTNVYESNFIIRMFAKQ